MSLLAEHMAERRARILAAARTLIADRGFEGLTMRELARASRVSVPTVYNLFGGKHAVLLAEPEETFAAVAGSLETVGGRGVVERAFAICETGNRELLAVPAYSRELVHVFLVAEETRPMRRAINERYVELMAGVLADGQEAGELVRWIDPTILARRMFAHYVHAMIEWAGGELGDDEFRAATELGMSLLLLGVATGRARRALATHAEKTQGLLSPRRTRRGFRAKGG